MVNTRGNNGVSGSGLRRNDNPNDGTPPQPASPIDLQNLGAFLVAQTQLMQTMMQQMQNMTNQPIGNNNQQGNNGQRSYSKLSDFMRTRPPTFSGNANPLEADDWLRTIERKLHITQCEGNEKVLYATHQLEGTAAEWWENYCAAREAPQEITWEEFSAAFRQYHVPEGMMDLKKEEFRALKQGGQSVAEYLNKFTQLARYAPEDVATDKARQSRFLKGLTSGLQVGLITHNFPDFQELVNKALILEDKRKELSEDRKRRMASPVGQPNQLRIRMIPQQFARIQPQWTNKTSAQSSCPTNQDFQTPAPVGNASTGSQQSAVKKCFSCNEPGHFANKCPKKGNITPIPFNLGTTPAKAPVTGSNRVPVQSGSSPQIAMRGRINHITTDEVQDAVEVVLEIPNVNTATEQQEDDSLFDNQNQENEDSYPQACDPPFDICREGCEEE